MRFTAPRRARSNHSSAASLTDHAGKVRVVGICPGTIDTPMLAATCEGWDKPVEELYAEVAKKHPGAPPRSAHRHREDGCLPCSAMTLEYINATSIVLDGGTMALPPW
jgi:NAD(P)-dependent dehydrogenase (short-subunit alcohol dehydrogenase family)